MSLSPVSQKTGKLVNSVPLRFSLPGVVMSHQLRPLLLAPEVPLALLDLQPIELLEHPVCSFPNLRLLG